MANLRGGGFVGFDALSSVPPPPSTVAYMQNAWNNTVSRFTQGTQDMLSYVADKIAPYNYQTLQQIAASVYNRVDSMWMDDRIQPLWDVSHFQFPPSTMVRWIMAEPTIRELYHMGQAEGYGENYIDTAKGLRGEDHLDYRLVLDGMWYEEAEGDFTRTDFLVESRPEFNPDYDTLNFIEQSSIISSWNNLAAIVNRRDDDPTSQFGAKL